MDHWCLNLVGVNQGMYFVPLFQERLLTHVLCFFLPLGVMTYCYAAVAVTLHHSQRGQRSLEKEGAIRLAALVTAVFCLCWLPYNITMLV